MVLMHLGLPVAVVAQPDGGNFGEFWQKFPVADNRYTLPAYTTDLGQPITRERIAPAQLLQWVIAPAAKAFNYVSDLSTPVHHRELSGIAALGRPGRTPEAKRVLEGTDPISQRVYYYEARLPAQDQYQPVILAEEALLPDGIYRNFYLLNYTPDGTLIDGLLLGQTFGCVEAAGSAVARINLPYITIDYMVQHFDLLGGAPDGDNVRDEANRSYEVKPNGKIFVGEVIYKTLTGMFMDYNTGEILRFRQYGSRIEVEYAADPESPYITLNVLDWKPNLGEMTITFPKVAPKYLFHFDATRCSLICHNPNNKKQLFERTTLYYDP